MSTTVDERVVSMRFDNQNFEKNVSTTMSTLDKLKEKLHLNGATKGLQDVNAAAGKVNMSGLGSAVETVSAKFSALQVMGVTALANITNSAVDAGKRLVKSLSVDQLTAGWSKYEQKTANVQTLVNATGKSVDEINGYLQKLMWFSDETSYGFTDMTGALSTMVSSGGDINKLIPMIMGVANATAFAGKGAAEFSRIMQYGVNQAYSLGYMQVMDWKTLEGATVNSKQLMEALIRSGEELGKIEEGSITAATFRSSLADKWLDKEVMEAGFGKFSELTEAAYRLLNGDLGDFPEEIQKLYDEGKINTAADAIEALSEHYDEVAVRAFKSAQEAKSFKEAIEATKDAVSSGWLRTFEIIFGSYDKAKVLWTELANTLWDLFAAGAEVRNWILNTALNFVEPWSAIEEKLGGVTKVIEDLKGATGTLEYFQDVVFRVWMGDYNNQGDNPDRRDLLKAAGYDPRVVQYLVNKGFLYKLTIEDITEAHEKFGLTLASTDEEIEEITKTFNDLNDEQLKSAGLTEEEIELYRALEKEAEQTGTTLSDLAKRMSEVDGRTLLIDSFKNIGSMFLDTLNLAKEAFTEIFNPPGAAEMAIRLYSILDVINKFTEKLRFTNKIVDENGEVTYELNEKGENLKRTLKGVFAILNIITTIIGGGLRIALKVVSGILKYFKLDILEVTAIIGDACVAFKGWFDRIFDISWLLDAIVPAIDSAVDAIRKWFEAFKASDGVTKAIETMNEFVDSIREWWAVLGESENIPKTIADGIVNFFSNIPGLIRDVLSHIWDGFKESFSGAKFADTLFGGFIESARYYLGIAGQTFAELGKILLEKLNTFLTARGFREISEDSIAGLVEGLKTGASKAWNAAVEIAKQIYEKVCEFLDIHSPSRKFIFIGSMIIAGLIAGLLKSSPELMETFKGVLDGILTKLNTMIPGLGDAFKNLGGTISETVKKIDFGTILAGAIGVGMTYATANMSKAAANFADSFGEIGGAIAKGIGNTFVGVKKVLKGFRNMLNGMAMESIGKTIKDFAIALGILVAAIIALAYVCGDDRFDVWEAIGVIAALSVVLIGIAAVASLLGKAAINIGKEGIEINNLMPGLISIGAALLMVALTAKLLGNMDAEAMKRGFQGIAGAVLAIVAVLAACKFLVKGDMTGTAARVGKTVLQIGLAMLVLAVVAKMIAKMEWGDMGKAVIGMSGLVLMISSLIIATKLAGPHADKVGGTMLKIGLAMGILVIVAKIIAGMEWSEMGKAAVGMLGFTGIVALLILATKLAGNNTAKIAGTMLGISTAIMAMAFTVKMLGGIDTSVLTKGTAMVLIFSGIIVGLIAATKLAGANASKIAITMLGVAVALGAMALAVALLGVLSVDHLTKGLVAVGLMSAMISAMIMATKNARNAKNSLIGIAIVIAVLTASLVALSLIDDPKKLIAPLASMIAVMGMLALVISSLGKARKANKAIGPLIALSGIILILAGVIFAMCYFMDDMGKAVKASAAVSVLVVALSGVLFVLSKMRTGGNIYGGILALAVLGLVVLELGLILGEINKANIGNAMPTVLSLSVLLIALTGVLAACVGLGTILQAPSVMLGLVVAIAALGLLGLVVWEIGAIVRKLHENGLDGNAIGTVAVLSTILIAMTAVLVACAGLGVILQAPTVMLGLVVAIAALGLLGLVVWEIGAIIRKLHENGLDESAAGTIMVLSTILIVMSGVLAVLAVVGLLAAPAVAGVAAMIIAVTSIGALIIALGTLSSECEGFDGFLDKGVGILSKIGLAIGEFFGSIVAGFSASVLSIVPMVGMALSSFMIFAQPFITMVSDVDDSVLKGAGYLTAAILMLTAADFIAGIASFGGVSFVTLGLQLSGFMQAGKYFFDEAKNIDPAAMEGVKSLAEAVALLTGANVLDGIFRLFTGGNSLEDFALQLPFLGKGLKGLYYQLCGVDLSRLNMDAVTGAITCLATAAKEIPNTGGLLGALIGNNDLGPFADQFPKVGAGLRDFRANLEDFTEADGKIVERAAAAVNSLAKAAAEIPNAGGHLANWIGDNDLRTFALKFITVAASLRDFKTNVGEFTESDKNTMCFAAEAISSIAKAASDIPNAGGKIAEWFGDNDLSVFADEFPALGTSLKTFIGNIGTFGDDKLITVSAAVRAINTLTDLANADLSSATTYLPSFGDNITYLASDISAFCADMPSVTTMNAAISNLDKLLAATLAIGNANSGCLSTFADNLKKIGKKAVDKFIEAFTSTTAQTDLQSSAKTLAGYAVTGAESKATGLTNTMESAGKDLGDGLVKGIDAKQTAVYNAGYRLGQKAVQGEKDGQQSNSPSKLTIQAGKWIGEGLVIGMGKMAGNVYNAGRNLGSEATNTISSAVSKVAELVNTDIDAQPTIRPVLDLSDVRSGVGTIGSLLAGNNSIGVRANIGAISSMMGARSQNGVNTDVVSAIDKLRKDLGNVNHNSYSISGINVSEGTEAADAIHTLVRVIKMEGRS
jgi:hypothetical protein